MKNLSREFISTLVTQAERCRWTDEEDFCPCDFSGGNYDDAYSGGRKDGETSLAREILDQLGVKYTIPKSGN